MIPKTSRDRPSAGLQYRKIKQPFPPTITPPVLGRLAHPALHTLAHALPGRARGAPRQRPAGGIQGGLGVEIAHCDVSVVGCWRALDKCDHSFVAPLFVAPPRPAPPCAVGLQAAPAGGGGTPAPEVRRGRRGGVKRPFEFPIRIRTRV